MWAIWVLVVFLLLCISFAIGSGYGKWVTMKLISEEEKLRKSASEIRSRFP